MFLVYTKLDHVAHSRRAQVGVCQTIASFDVGGATRFKYFFHTSIGSFYWKYIMIFSAYYSICSEIAKSWCQKRFAWEASKYERCYNR
jgi:hypothetical protein